MSNITAVIFDFNGTLYFDSHLHIEAWKRFLKLHGFPAMTDEQFKEKFLGRNNAEIMEMLHGRVLPTEEMEALAEEKAYLCHAVGDIDGCKRNAGSKGFVVYYLYAVCKLRFFKRAAF